MAMKVITTDESVFDKNAIYYLFNEISILDNMKQEKMLQSSNYLEYFDYGINDN